VNLGATVAGKAEILEKAMERAQGTTMSEDQLAIAVLAQEVLHALLPSRLKLDPEGLHLRIWVTWGGVFSRFRRSDVLVKWDEIAGIAFGEAQVGETQVFIAHTLGWDCYAGFTGGRREA